MSALLLHFSAIPSNTFSEENSEGRRLAHNLAQYVHCLAQGKVGSGFDVSAAVFGSHRYTRFDPAVLDHLMKSDTVRRQILSKVGFLSAANYSVTVAPYRTPAAHSFPEK